MHETKNVAILNFRYFFREFQTFFKIINLFFKNQLFLVFIFLPTLSPIRLLLKKTLGSHLLRTLVRPLSRIRSHLQKVPQTRQQRALEMDGRCQLRNCELWRRKRALDLSPASNQRLPTNKILQTFSESK